MPNQKRPHQPSRRPLQPMRPQPPMPPQPPRNREQHRVQSAEERYYKYLEKRDEKNIIYDDEIEKLERKGSLNSLTFEGELTDDENAFIISGEEDKEADKGISVSVKKIILSVICLLLAFGLNFVQISFPNTPSIVRIDFSALPELLAALAVNPLVGIAIVILKNFFYYLFKPTAIASIPGKIILDCVFIILIWFVAFILMKTKPFKSQLTEREEKGLPYRAYSIGALSIGSIISVISTAFLSVFTLKRILLPLLYKLFGDYGYTPENIFKSYQIAHQQLILSMPFVERYIPTLNDLNTGIMLYNIPLNIIKYFVCAILGIVAYYFINDMINKEP